jgi:type IV secretory pathway TrbD component
MLAPVLLVFALKRWKKAYFGPILWLQANEYGR